MEMPDDSFDKKGYVF